MEQMELVKIEDVTQDSGAVVMQKGSGHKYVKRELVSVQPKKYRYWYRSPAGGLVTSASLHEGAKFRHGAGDQKGHVHVDQVHKDDAGNVTHVTISHDEGHFGDKKVSVDELKDMLHYGEHEHGETVDKRTDRLLKDWAQVQKTGSPKQVANMRQELKEHAQTHPKEADAINAALEEKEEAPAAAKTFPKPAIDDEGAYKGGYKEHKDKGDAGAEAFQKEADFSDWNADDHHDAAYHHDRSYSAATFDLGIDPAADNLVDFHHTMREFHKQKRDEKEAQEKEPPAPEKKPEGKVKHQAPSAGSSWAEGGYAEHSDTHTHKGESGAKQMQGESDFDHWTAEDHEDAAFSHSVSSMYADGAPKEFHDEMEKFHTEQQGKKEAQEEQKKTEAKTKEEAEKGKPGEWDENTDPEYINKRMGELEGYFGANADNPHVQMFANQLRQKTEDMEEEMEGVFEKHGVSKYASEDEITPALKKEMTGKLAELGNYAFNTMKHIEETGKVPHPGKMEAPKPGTSLGELEDQVAQHSTHLMLHHFGDPSGEGASFAHSKAMKDVEKEFSSLPEAEQQKQGMHGFLNKTDEAIQHVNKNKDKLMEEYQDKWGKPGEFGSHSDSQWMAHHVGEMGKFLSTKPDNAHHQVVSQLIARKMQEAQEKGMETLEKHGVPSWADEEDIPPEAQKEMTGHMADASNEAHKMVQHLKDTGKIPHPGKAHEGMSKDELQEHMQLLNVHHAGTLAPDFGSDHDEAFDKVEEEMRAEHPDFDPDDKKLAAKFLNRVDEAYSKIPSEETTKSILHNLAKAQGYCEAALTLL